MATGKHHYEEAVELLAMAGRQTGERGVNSSTAALAHAQLAAIQLSRGCWDTETKPFATTVYRAVEPESDHRAEGL